MLCLNNVTFQYVIPRGKTGSDYDVDIIYPNGVHACADAKCKITGTPFSNKTLDSTLEKARRQLPDDRPGIVFVKLPPEWAEAPNFEDISVSVARDFLRTTRRVVSVKLYVQLFSFENGSITIKHAFKEISNPRTDFGDDVDWRIFQLNMPPEWNGVPPWWQRILFYPDGKGIVHEKTRHSI